MESFLAEHNVLVALVFPRRRLPHDARADVGPATAERGEARGVVAGRNLALAADRDLGDRRRIAAVAHELRDAAMDAGRQRLAVVGLGRRRIQGWQRLHRTLRTESATHRDSGFGR
mgnify:CR=1 FL=1